MLGILEIYAFVMRLMRIIGDSCEFTQGCMTILNELKCVDSQLREYFNGNIKCESDLIR